jgi:undecaprenyl-diphosphatase
VLASLLALPWGGWRLGAVVLGAALLDFANDGVKALVGRPRPFNLAETDSFPSGHTVHAVLFLGVLWLLLAPRLHRRWQRTALGGSFVSLGLLVGISRIYLGRHWPSDVLGAYLVGGLALWGLTWAAAARGWLARER